MTVPPTPTIAAPQPSTPPAPPDGKIRFFRCFYYPFLDKPWHWAPNLIAIVALSYVPVLGWMVAWGWSLTIAHRYRFEPRTALPRWNSVGGYLLGWFRFLLCGFVVFLVDLIFYKLPCFLLALALFFQQLVGIHATLTSWYNSWQNSEPMPELTGERLMAMGQEYVVSNLVWLSIKTGVTVAFFCLAQLVFVGGVVRYTRSGSLWAFTQPFRNLWVVLRNGPSFFLAMIYWIVLKLLLFVLGLILTWTGVGVIFVPLTFAVDFLFLGYLYGQLAARVDIQIERDQA